MDYERLLTSFIGKLFGASALYRQTNQKANKMDKSVMTEQEFEQMVERMRPRLMQMGREFFGSDTEAEEVVQETWLRAWNVREKVMLTDAYVLRIARNCCVSMWRGHRTQVELTDEEGSVVSEVTPEEEMEERENSEWLQSRLKQLPKTEQEVWDLFYEQGLTVEEIAEVRGVSVATVRKTISHVRSRLRTELRRHFIGLRHLLLFALLALSTGIAIAVIISPAGRVRGVIEKVFNLPEDTTIYETPECLPSYRGDVDALYRHIAFEMHYPDSAIEKGIEGRVIIRFVVEKDGRLTNFEVLKSPDDLLSKEALRVLHQTEPWIPAQNEGRPVRSHFCMPITFRLR